MKSTSTDLPADLAGAIDAVRPSLAPLGSRIVYFPSVASTNDIAATLASAGDAEGAVVIADHQTSGRGRRGRVWFSPPGSGLYVSVVLTPVRAADPRRATMLLTMTAAVALADAIETTAGIAPAIKWPNDLLIGRRKLAGILAEGISSAGTSRVDAVVLGYGINVGPMAYPPELADRATSLESELGTHIDRAVVLAHTLAALAVRYADLLAGRFGAILDAWSSRARGIRGATVTWATASGRATGVTAGVDDDGALLVRMADRVERIVSGEVTWL